MSSIDWRKNQISDMSGNGNTGTLVNMSTTTSPVAGKIGQALKFDGSTGYVNNTTFSLASLLNRKCSPISMWVKIAPVALVVASVLCNIGEDYGTPDNGASASTVESKICYIGVTVMVTSGRLSTDIYALFKQSGTHVVTQFAMEVITIMVLSEWLTNGSVRPINGSAP